jgi:protein-tyrosine-phosphatase
MIRRLKAAAKGVLREVTRLRHPRRRARARRALEAANGPRSVLFLCLGNVCRSPYAEVSCRRMSPHLEVSSAGFIGPGRSAPEEAQKVARERGLDLSGHTSRLVTAEAAGRHDLIIVMEPGQRGELRRKVGETPLVIVLGDLDPVRPGTRAIPDPWGGGLDAFRSSFERIDRCLGELVPFVEDRRGR